VGCDGELGEKKSEEDVHQTILEEGDEHLLFRLLQANLVVHN
jgi:hypothetical protein